MNRHCLTMTARAELNLWSKYWSRAVVGGGVLYILYCGVYILKWVAAFFLSIYHRCCLHKPSHSHWQGNACRTPSWALFAKIFTSTLPKDELTPPVLLLVVSLYLPFSSSLQSWVWDHIYLLGLRLGPYLRCTRAAPPCHHPVITALSALYNSISLQRTKHWCLFKE